MTNFERWISSYELSGWCESMKIRLGRMSALVLRDPLADALLAGFAGAGFIRVGAEHE